VLTWRAYRREHIPLLAVVLVTLIPYWVVHTETRYVLPASLAYIIWIAVGADLFADRALARLRMLSPRRVSRSESLVHSKEGHVRCGFDRGGSVPISM